MSESILKIEHLYHRYSQQWAVEDINLEIGKRGVWGLLGSNGAGKSTTMNIICGKFLLMAWILRKTLSKQKSI